MQQHEQYGRLYSASDLVAYLGCQHRTMLDLRRLAGWDVQPATPDAALQLVQQYGNAHEREHLEGLVAGGSQIVEIDKNAPLADQVKQTRAAMHDGAEIIFQATLLKPPFLGYADFLVRVPGRSRFGDYHYEVADTKLAKSNQAKFLVQLGLYADLLAAEQDVLPERLHIVLGRLDAAELQRRGLPTDGPNTATVRTQDCIHYVRNLTAGFLEFVARQEARTEPNTRALPNAACGACPWRDHCDAEWEANDHVCLVANIRRSQILRLETAGVTTMKGLAALGANPGVRGIDDAVLGKLVQQAELQTRPNDEAGQLRWTALEARADGEPSGFDLLPEPDPGDLYFDMEGFPHVPGGLEYLFGVGWVDSTKPGGFDFKPFWAHDRAQEKQAFESFMDFVEDHLAKHPKAHIYHYAPYERTAIKRLSSVHATRVEFRDRLLREHQLVDLYRVVRSGMLLALPSYSIKKVEKYYRDEREGDVATAGESIVKYEAYRVSQEPAVKKQFLQEIERYNRDDVESTWQLHRWLEERRPANACRLGDGVEAAEAAPTSDKAREREDRERAGIEKLNAWAAQDPAMRGPLAELLGQLLGFYWRCKLPTLWRKYERLEAEPEDLLEDQECLAMLKFRGERELEAKSWRYFYDVPDQQTKLGTGATVRCLTDGGPASGFVYDEETGIASFTRGVNRPAPPELISLCAHDDVSYASKLDSIHAYVDAVCAGHVGLDAVQRLLTRAFPNVQGIRPGDSLMPLDTPDAERVDAMLKVISNLDASHLVVQGPPGTGKTTFASQVIARLVKAGRKVAIMSNSHAAINHLLVSSWKRCKDAGIETVAAVVRKDDKLPQDIRVLSSDDVDSEQHSLVGGTAWLFCREKQRDRWDYLFVDEASQVSLADVVAAGPCARNIVLLGDQMQLPQPTQGIHPGDSGLSALEFIMRNQATVPPSEGIFLGSTFRMHPAVCEPVSEGVYEGRLKPDQSCEQQRLLLGADADPALRPNGVVWVPIVHTDRSQSAPEETERIDTLYRSLLAQRWVNHKGEERAITAADILVLAPYNAQVRALKQKLGPDARVGTVDKFQGQEAAVAICSMTSSDADSMPRGLDFLFSINRLNVAVSRARCLALIVASPGLRTPPCGSVEDVRRASFFARLTSGVETGQKLKGIRTESLYTPETYNRLLRNWTEGRFGAQEAGKGCEGMSEGVLFYELLDLMRLRKVPLPSVHYEETEEPQEVLECLLRLGVLERGYGPFPDAQEYTETVLDLLGVYHSTSRSITLYRRLIRQCARTLELEESLLERVVLVHEMAHAATHLGVDSGGLIWERFSEAGPDTVEYFAQLFAHILFRDQGDDVSVACMIQLAAIQPRHYRRYLEHIDAASETIAAELYDARRRLPGLKRTLCSFCQLRIATTSVERCDTWQMRSWLEPACSYCAPKNKQTWMT